MDVSKKGLVGIALIIVGTLLFVPGTFAESGLLIGLGLAAASLLLSAGTYLVGTDVDGQIV